MIWLIIGLSWEFTVKWGKLDWRGELGQSLDPLKQRLTCMSRLLDFRKHSGEASKTPSAPPKTRPCSRFSVFKLLNFVPTRPASPDSPHFTVPKTVLPSFYFHAQSRYELAKTGVRFLLCTSTFCRRAVKKEGIGHLN